MSYHCTGWVNDFSDNTDINGRDIDDLWGDYGCHSFRVPGTFYVDTDGDINDSSMDTGADAECAEHDRICSWDGPADPRTDLQDAGFYVCSNCYLVWDIAAGLQAHIDAGHEQEAVNFTVNPARRHVTTSHSAWTP